MIRVFDTSALIYDPRLITDGYPGDEIVIPMTAIREIDKIKSEREHPGSAAREVVRRIDSIRVTSPTIISEGIQRPIGGKLRVELNHITDTSLVPEHASVTTNDERIILATLNLAKDNPDEDVVLVTQDGSMSIIAESWGVKTMRHEVVDSNEKLPSGVVYVTPQYDEIDELHSQKTCEIEETVPVNTGVVISSGSQSGIGISDGLGNIDLIDRNIMLHGIAPKGVEQIVAANLLMGRTNGHSDTEFLGSLSGRAGAGKTLLALSAGIKRMLANEYHDIIIYRPTEPVGRDLGFLPGNLDEKMKPWTAAIEDVLEAMAHDPNSVGGKTIESIDSIKDRISIESANFVRGRTLRNKWIIIEEAQNYEPVVLRTLLSRAGEGSAVVLTWDPSQVDNAYLRRNAADAPMSVLQNLLGDPMVWHVELHNPERGGVSALVD